MHHPAFVPEGYTLLRPLGSGNTAYVYEAQHPQYGTVALKLPKSELQHDPVLRRMFENEVQLTTPLRHPRVINAYGGYPTGEGAFLALEFCEGTLDAMLGNAKSGDAKSGVAEAQLPLELAYQLVLEVAQGLSHSHQRQILHRDVKPANVFLRDAHAKLGDFGTGAYISDTFGAPPNTERVGTAFYMAPEIFQGRSASVRSDVYSLGILAYEVIAGTRPFTGDDKDDLMLAHSSGVPVALRQLRPEVSAEVNRVVSRAMSRTPEKRFESAEAFVTAFADATGQPASAAVTELRLGRAGRAPHAEKSKPDTPTAEKSGRFGWFGRKRS